MNNQQFNGMHRPWSCPDRPWVMNMRWRELLFAHWEVPQAVLRKLIPESLEIDTFEDSCYVGCVPFLMENVTPRFVPALPGLHAFPELNLRTYVKAGDKPGVWFFSLDAGQKLAVRIARSVFHLPYFDARFKVSTGASIHYCAERIHRNAPKASLEVQYEPTGPIYRSQKGSIDEWLTERYCLYSADPNGKLWRGEIDHQPWPLQPTKATFTQNSLGEGFGIPLEGPPKTLHYAKSLDVRAWLIERVLPES